MNQIDHPSKKRKFGGITGAAASWANVQSYVDISFSIPVRKKLKLEVGSQPDEGFRGKSGDEIEVSASWSTVRSIFCLPVPEKAQRQYNFCVIYGNQLAPKTEQTLWTVPEAVPKDGVINPPPPAGSEDDTYRTLLCTKINNALEPHGLSITEPNEADFASQIPPAAHRKWEKAYHVKAFRGSKDGFLFFLSTGIFWGFKKPLEFFPFDDIDSVSYTSVLQRTFNLNIVARFGGEDLLDNIALKGVAAETRQEVEFSMLDQADFAGIDEYVRRHRLQDASMAERRRAKKVNVNGAKGGGAGGDAEAGGDDGVEGEGELAKAAREAQDLQDEEEEEEDENFDPGSEGESEGEGSDSDEDDEGSERNGWGGEDGEEEDDDDEGEEGDEL